MYTALFCKSCWPVNNAIRYFLQLCDMVFFQCDQPTANFKVIGLMLNPTPLLKQDMSVDRPCCPINISRTFAGRTSDLADCSPYTVDDTVDYNVTGTTAKVQTTLKRLHPVDLALFTQYLYFFCSTDIKLEAMETLEIKSHSFMVKGQKLLLTLLTREEVAHWLFWETSAI